MPKDNKKSPESRADERAKNYPNLRPRPERDSRVIVTAPPRDTLESAESALERVTSTEHPRMRRAVRLNSLVNAPIEYGHGYPLNFIDGPSGPIADSPPETSAGSSVDLEVDLSENIEGDHSENASENLAGSTSENVPNNPSENITDSPENSTGGPLEIAAGDISENVAVGPSENIAGSPSENKAGGPSENIAGGPLENVPGDPSTTLTGEPSKNFDDISAENVAIEPTENLTSGPPENSVGPEEHLPGTPSEKSDEATHDTPDKDNVNQEGIEKNNLNEDPNETNSKQKTPPPAICTATVENSSNKSPITETTTASPNVGATQSSSYESDYDEMIALAEAVASTENVGGSESKTEGDITTQSKAEEAFTAE